MTHPHPKPGGGNRALSALVALVATALAAPALADTSAEPLEGAVPPDASPETRLVTLMMNDEKAHMTALRDRLAEASRQGEEERADRLNARIDSLAADHREEEDAVRREIESLEDAQVTRLAEALGAVEQLGADLDIDADALNRVRTDRYDPSQIEWLVSVYEQTRDLSRKAERLTLEAEITGNDELLEEAQKAAAEAQKRREELLDHDQDL